MLERRSSPLSLFTSTTTSTGLYNWSVPLFHSIYNNIHLLDIGHDCDILTGHSISHLIVIQNLVVVFTWCCMPNLPSALSLLLSLHIISQTVIFLYMFSNKFFLITLITQKSSLICRKNDEERQLYLFITILWDFGS